MEEWHNWDIQLTPNISAILTIILSWTTVSNVKFYCSCRIELEEWGPVQCGDL